MTLDEADEAVSEIRRLSECLRYEFPCEACDGRGGDDPSNTAYPEPCIECWGTGFSVPDEG